MDLYKIKSVDYFFSGFIFKKYLRWKIIKTLIARPAQIHFCELNYYGFITFIRLIYPYVNRRIFLFFFLLHLAFN